MTFSREFLESGVRAAQIPGGNTLLAALAGIPIEETPLLRYDEMAFATGGRKLLVGELNHFMYRMRQLDENQKARKLAVQNIEDVAWRILGEHWRVSE